MLPFFHIRKATRVDKNFIHQLIHQVGINPLALNWRRFVIAVAENDVRVGCAQIKNHHDGSKELSSLAVIPTHRQQGVARALIEELLRNQQPPVHLTCRGSLSPFYVRFGFHEVQNTHEMPIYFRRVKIVFDWLDHHKWAERVAIMRWDGAENQLLQL